MNLIQVRQEAEALSWPEVLPILESLFPVKFLSGLEHLPKRAGEINSEDVPESLNGFSSVPTLGLPRRDCSSRKGAPVEISVRFSHEQDVPFPFQGRCLRTQVAAAPKALSLRANERVLASAENGPVWALSEFGRVKHFRSAFQLPGISQEGSLLDVLNGDRFLEMLPLLHWLRHVCGTAEYHGPPLRAAFIFDDPNLHWPSYGFVDFKQIAAHAEKENYHVSFATIPLDTWFTHRATADVFRMNSRRLSLAIHGNDHTKRELVKNYTQSQRIRLLRQAIQRIERLERNAGVHVSRVMVPPHGACSEEMLAEIPRCGFEAAFISHGSLRAHNRLNGWATNLGYLPSESIHGCPVLPRWGFAGNAENTILLAAFLRQAIVFRGHHQDLKHGIELLDGLARFVNGLGDVMWSNLTNLSRTNYSWRLNGDTFMLKPLGQKLDVILPREARRLLLVQGPSQAAEKRWRIEDRGDAVSAASAGNDLLLATGPSRTVLIEAVTERPVAAVSGSLRSSPWPHIRRLLTEGRDRLLVCS